MLTQIQRDAMARAQAGDWSLADAMEYDHYWSKGGQEYPLIGGFIVGGRLRYLAFGDRSECANCTGDGRCECLECDGEGYAECDECSGDGNHTCMTCKGSADDVRGCAACKKTGKVVCTECKGAAHVKCETCHCGSVECADCDGSGSAEASEGDVHLIIDLNGRRLYDVEAGEDWPDHLGEVNYTQDQARTVLHNYQFPKTTAPTSPEVQSDAAHSAINLEAYAA